MTPLFHMVFGIVQRIFGFALFFAIALAIVHMQTRQTIRDIQEQHEGKGLAAAASFRETLLDANRLMRDAEIIPITEINVR